MAAQRLGTGAAMRLVPRPLLVYTAALGVGDLGNGLARLAVPWLVYNATHSAAAMGLLSFFQMASSWGGPLIALVTDRIDRRAGAMVAVTGSALSLLAIALTERGPRPALWPVLLLVLAWQAFGLLQMQCNGVIRAALTPPEARIGINTWQFTVFNVSWYVSPGVAGLLIAARGANATMWLASLSALVVLVPALALPRVSPAPDAPRRHPAQDMAEAFAYLKADRELLSLALFGLVWNSGWAGVSALSVYFFRSQLHLGAATVGTVSLLAGLATTGVGLLTPVIERRIRASAVLVGTLAVSGAGMVLLGLSRFWLAAAAGLGAMEAPITPFDVLQTTTTQARVPTDRFARVLALRQFVAMGGMPVASLAAGLAARMVGAPAAIVATGALMLVSTAVVPFTTLAHLAWPGVDERPDP